MFACAALIATPLTAGTPPEKGQPPITEQTARSGGPIDPEQARLRFDHADLAIEVFPDREAISGIATLDFTARAPLTRLLLDLDRNLPVSAVSINGALLERSAWSNPQGRLAIELLHPLARGESVVARIEYGGTPHVAVHAPWDDGFVWSKTPRGAPWAATTAEGYGCDLFWPCLDFPTGEPARADLHITVPEGLKAPSNGVLKSVDTLPDGRTTWNWSAAQPNTYAIALNVAPYDELNGDYASRFGNHIPLRLWYLPSHAEGAKRLFAEFAPTLDFFEAMIGPYPFGAEKVGVVETPYLGMEHQTINAYGNGYRATPEGFDTIFQHELAHEWFGNQLTAANWDDYWLHEGYGTYMQPLYGEWRDGEARYATMMADLRMKIMNQAPIVSGRELTEEQVYETKNGGPGQDIYNKAAWMLHTLRNTIGDKAFFEVTRRIVYGRPDPKPGNFRPRYGSTGEYERIVREVTGKDYGWFFDVYLRQAALPDLMQTRNGNRLTLTWKTPGDKRFPLPVEVKVGDSIRKLPMTGGTATLTIPAGEHVVVDPHNRILKRDPAIERYKQWQHDRMIAG
ncbi:M1 family metallopeptidase [Stakelama marina]|uniref:Aminopeptidase N n=1 Tax=Stakelama marina TaxID=2826939 RepID=A0A8T4IDN0_9SPHN|nr:M1 family metallopeptidase [Stakelama marina]MBR0551964.1 M1 family metallopeptidase [Stakelama marina]